MAIKVKMRGDKATIRFSNPAEEKYFQNLMVSVRDGPPQSHPKISVKDRGNTEIPSLPKPKPIGKPVIVKPEPLKTDSGASVALKPQAMAKEE